MKTRPPIDRPRRFVGRNHPKTSQDMQRKALGRQGTKRRKVYVLLLDHGPKTDEQIRDTLNMSYPTETSTRCVLVKDGWVRDSGKRGSTRAGNEAIKWEAIP